MSLQDLTSEPIFIAALIAGGVFLFVVVVMSLVQSRVSISRRVSTIEGERRGRTSLGQREQREGLRFQEMAGKWLAPGTTAEISDVRRQLVQAGYFAPSAVYVFYTIRMLIALGLAATVPIVLPLFVQDPPVLAVAVLVPVAGLIGLIVPSVGLDWLRSGMRTKYRNAFPDFTDLTVVCIEAGQSIQGALDRVSRETAQFCPQLGVNLHLMNLEMRAGRTLSEGLDGLYNRVGIEEVKSLALLLKQSEELGSSIAVTLRVFSDEMRDKRLMRAEAKAYALPVKLTLPLGIFIFPVILLVILTPVMIRIFGVFGTS